MVGIAQLVSASDCGSEGRGFESHYPPHFYTGLSPSGKAQDFDSCIPMVRIHLAQPFCLANTGVSPRGKASDSGSDIPRVQILPPQPADLEGSYRLSGANLIQIIFCQHSAGRVPANKFIPHTGVSPRGKASDSGSDIPRVQILPPQPDSVRNVKRFGPFPFSPQKRGSRLRRDVFN